MKHISMITGINLIMDIFKFRRKKAIAAGIVTALCCVLMIIFPTIALYSARKGISLWISNVLPALLPFFICANFLQSLGVMRCFKSGIFPFAMSVLSGYPMGAKIVGDLRRDGDISLREAKRLMSFCSTSGPAFMVGAVGAGMLGSGFLGGIIAVSHYAGALINGVVYSLVLGKSSLNGKLREAKLNESGIQESFTEAILSSFKSLGIILAYIVLFMFMTDLFHMCGVFSLMENQGVRALLKGFFEMTVGCGAAAECSHLSAEIKCVICTAIMSWGGLSVIGQSMSMLSGSGISPLYLLLSKFTHCVFSTIVALITVFIML